MTYEKKGGTFGQNIKAEMMEFRGRLDAIESLLKTMGSGGSTGTSTSTGTVEFGGEVGEDAFPTGPVEVKEAAAENVKSYSQSVMEATYLVREATISVRGYGMLLDQMGLSRDQKRMVHQIEEGMMMVHKFIQAMKLLQAAQIAFEAEEGPLGWLEIALAGGLGAASIAYASKLRSGDV